MLAYLRLNSLYAQNFLCLSACLLTVCLSIYMYLSVCLFIFACYEIHSIFNHKLTHWVLLLNERANYINTKTTSSLWINIIMLGIQCIFVFKSSVHRRYSTGIMLKHCTHEQMESTVLSVLFNADRCFQQWKNVIKCFLLTLSMYSNTEYGCVVTNWK